MHWTHDAATSYRRVETSDRQHHPGRTWIREVSHERHTVSNLDTGSTIGPQAGTAAAPRPAGARVRLGHRGPGPHDLACRRVPRPRALPRLVQPGGPGGVRSRLRDAPLLLVPAGHRRVHRGDPDGPRLRHGILGHRDEPARQSAGRRARAGGDQGGLGGRREGQGPRRPDAARARLRGGDGVLLQGRRHGRPRDPRPRLRGRHGPGPRASPGRSRGGDLLRPGDERGHPRAAAGQDLRASPGRRAAPRDGPGGAAGPSRRAPLPDPQLRLSRPRRPRAPRGPTIRGGRLLRPARPPHAVAHLLDAGDVGGVHPLEPRRARRRQDVRARGGLHGVRAPPAGAGRGGAGAGGRDGRPPPDPGSGRRT